MSVAGSIQTPGRHASTDHGRRHRVTSTHERSTSSHEAPAPARPRVRWQVFIPAAIATLIITLWAFLRPEYAKAVLGSMVGWTAGWFGWFYVALEIGRASCRERV